MKERVCTGNNVEVIKFKSPMGQFYFQRLTDALESVWEVSRGLYPYDYYEGLPLKQQGQAKGLWYGLEESVSSFYAMCVELGEKDIADAALKFHRTRMKVSKNEQRV